MTASTVPGSAAPDRHISLERVFNFRDLGGYPTADGRHLRWRRLFRSAEHHRMSVEEARRLRAEVGIATVIDLRAAGEATHELEPGPLVGPGVRRHVLGMGDPKAKYRAREAGTWRPNFVQTLAGGAEQWAAAVTLLADEATYPALFHCVTGKDRTGVLAALILDLVGVDDETIVDDYALSQQAMDRLVAYMREHGIMAPDQERNPALAVVPDAMREMLDDLHERHGSAREFLRDAGVDDPTLDRVTELLVE